MKTAAIITGVLTPYSVELLSKDLQKVSFVGMGTDSSNHGNTTMFPITVQYYDYRQGGMPGVVRRSCMFLESSSCYLTKILQSFSLCV